MPHTEEQAAQLAVVIANSGGGGGGGASVFKASAALSAAGYSCTQTVTLPGCTTSSIVLASLAHHSDADENSAELLDLAGLSAQALTGQALITASFATHTAGLVRVNLLAS